MFGSDWRSEEIESTSQPGEEFCFSTELDNLQGLRA